MAHPFNVTCRATELLKEAVTGALHKRKNLQVINMEDGLPSESDNGGSEVEPDISSESESTSSDMEEDEEEEDEEEEEEEEEGEDGGSSGDNADDDVDVDLHEQRLDEGSQSRDRRPPSLLLTVLHGRMVVRPHVAEGPTPLLKQDPRATHSGNPVADIPQSLDMEASVWSYLPEVLLHRVLAMLPTGIKCKFSAVSKSWRALISSPQFKELCAMEVAAVPSAICALEYQPGWPGLDYEDRVNFSRRLPGFRAFKVGLSFLPEHFQHFESSEFVVGDGLVCIFKLERRKSCKRNRDCASDSDSDAASGSVSKPSAVVGMRFCVVNPLTRTWMELPPEFGPDDSYEGNCLNFVAVHRTPHGYFRVEVISKRASKMSRKNSNAASKLPGRRALQLTASIYCSKTNTWRISQMRKVREAPPGRGDHREFVIDHREFAVCNGLLYTIDPEAIQVHSLETGEFLKGNVLKNEWWSKLQFSQYARHCQRCHYLRDIKIILVHCGKIFCVDNCLWGEENSTADVQDYLQYGIWQLDPSSLLWNPVTFFPANLQQIIGCAADEATMFWLHKDPTLLEDRICLTICFDGPGYPDVFGWHLVTYDIKHDSWESLIGGVAGPYHDCDLYIIRPGP